MNHDTTLARNGLGWQLLVAIAVVYLIATLALLSAAVYARDYTLLNGMVLGISASLAVWVVYEYRHGGERAR